MCIAAGIDSHSRPSRRVRTRDEIVELVAAGGVRHD
jgi:hypothetical protein